MKVLKMHPLVVIFWVVGIIASTACTTLAVHAYLNPYPTQAAIQDCFDAQKDCLHYADSLQTVILELRDE
jgi:hypothetical protein